MKITRKQLIAVAEELNVHPDDGGPVGFEPPINTKLPKQQLMAEILRKCNGVAFDDDGNETLDPSEGLLLKDKLTIETWQICAALGNKIAQKRVKEMTPEPEPEPEPLHSIKGKSPTERVINLLLKDRENNKTRTNKEIGSICGIKTINYVAIIRRIVHKTLELTE